MAKQHDAVAMTEEQLDVIAGRGKVARYARKAVRRVARLQKRANYFESDDDIHSRVKVTFPWGDDDCDASCFIRQTQSRAGA